MFHPRGPTLKELFRQGMSSTVKGYDLLAGKFDYSPFRTPDEVLAVIAEEVGGTDSVLDLGCGTGAVLRALQPQCRRHLVGIDFSRGMLAEARGQSQESAGGAAVYFVRGDFLHLPFTEKFDLAVCSGALGHILPREENQFLREIWRVLKPGGRFVFVTAEYPPVVSLRYWSSRIFNAVLLLRNFFWHPPFIMYYLTFALPGICRQLEVAGFTVEVRGNLFPPPYSSASLVIATKPA